MSGSQPVGFDLFDKPLYRKLFALQFLSVATFQLRCINENNFMVRSHCNIRNCIKRS